MKKVVFTVIAIFLLSIMIYSTYRVNYLSNDNKNLEEKIVKIKKDTETEKENSIKYEEEKETIEEESKDKKEEYEIWKKAVEKLEKAL